MPSKEVDEIQTDSISAVKEDIPKTDSQELTLPGARACATLVRSRQSMQLVRRTPDCSTSSGSCAHVLLMSYIMSTQCT